MSFFFNIFHQTCKAVIENNFIQKTSIANYQYNRSNHIGHGTYGIVYIGHQKDNKKQKVAIKVISLGSKLPIEIKSKTNPLLNQDQLINPEVISTQLKIQKMKEDQDIKISKMIQEIQLMVKLDSNYIVKILGWGRTEDDTDKIGFGIILQFMDGSLEKLLESYKLQDKKISQKEAIEWMRKIIECYQTFYANNVIHRDLKPANILYKMQHDGSQQKMIIKIADLGIARNFENKTMTGKASWAYQSPQQNKCIRYNQKTDVYPLGIMMFQFLLGEGNYPIQLKCVNYKTRETNHQQVQRVLKSKNISKQTINFIQKCLKFSQKDRYSWEQIFSHPIFGLNNQQLLQKLKEQKKKFNSTSNQQKSIQKQMELLLVIDDYQTLLQMSNKYKNNQKFFLAKKYCEKALRIIQQNFKKNSELYIIIYEIYGQIFEKEKNLIKALEIYKKVLQYKEKFYKKDVFQCVSTLILIGKIIFEQSNYKQSKKYYERAKSIIQKQKGKMSNQFARILCLQGNICRQEKQFDQARKKMHFAKEISLRINQDQMGITAQYIQEQGKIQKQNFQFKAAIDFYIQALNIYTNMKVKENKQIKRRQYLDYGKLLCKIGEVRYNQEKFQEMITYFNDSMKIYEEVLKEKSKKDKDYIRMSALISLHKNSKKNTNALIKSEANQKQFHIQKKRIYSNTK